MFQTMPGAVTPLGNWNVTLTAVAQTLDALIKNAIVPSAAGLPVGARHFVLITEGAVGARWSDAAPDCAAPSSGTLLPAGVPLEVWNADARILLMKFCRDGGANTTASLWVGK